MRRHLNSFLAGFNDCFALIFRNGPLLANKTLPFKGKSCTDRWCRALVTFSDRLRVTFVRPYGYQRSKNRDSQIKGIPLLMFLPYGSNRWEMEIVKRDFQALLKLTMSCRKI